MTEEKFKRAAELKQSLARLNYELSGDYFERCRIGELAERFLTDDEILQMRTKIKARVEQRRDELQKEFDAL